MNKIKQLLRIQFLCIISFAVMFVGCQKDDDNTVSGTVNEHNPQAQVVTSSVTPDDIPEVMSYISTLGDQKGNFQIEKSVQGNHRSSEEDLVISTLQTKEIIQVIDQYNRKNHTFLLTSIESNDPDAKSTFNLIVQELPEGLFSYITEYRPDSNWIPNYRNAQDFSTYSGKIIHYNINGNYIAKLNLSNGIAVSGETKNACPDDGDPNGDNGNNGGNDGSNGDGSVGDGSNGDGGNDNDGGIDINIFEFCVPCSHDNHNPHSQACAHPVCTTVIEINQKSYQNHLRTVCGEVPVVCHQPNNDPCPCNSDETGCADETNNNDDTNDTVGVFFNLSTAAIKIELTDELDLTENQVNWLEDKNLNELQNVREFLIENDYSEESKHAIKITINVDQNNNLEEGYNEDFMEAVNCCNGPILIINPNLGVKYYAYMRAEVAIIKQSNYPEEHEFTSWELTKIYWQANLSALQLGLDVIGLIPGFGEVADLINGGIYTISGDGVNASLSYASAIPIAGWFATGAKWAKKTVNITADINSRVTLKWIISGDLIKFGNRSQLRKVLQITDSGVHAHHIIPWASNAHPLVQKAAKSTDAFHLNEALNGIPRPTSLHLTGHGIYNDKILEILDEAGSNLSNDQAYDFINNLATTIRNIIETNPNLNSGQIAQLLN